MEGTTPFLQAIDRWAAASSGGPTAGVAVIQAKSTKCARGSCVTTVLPTKVVKIEPMCEWGPHDPEARAPVLRILNTIAKGNKPKGRRRRKTATSTAKPLRRSKRVRRKSTA